MVGGATPAADVGAQQQGVVVEHLLEVRHHPARVDGVAVETPADLVADAAARHRLQAALRQLQAAGVAAHQQRVQRRRGRELRGGAETGVDQVEVGGDRLDGGVDLGGVVRQGRRGEGRQMPGHHVRTRDQGLPVGFPGVGQGLQHLRERRASRLRFGREVGAREERAALRGEEGCQGPAARALVHQLRGRHVHLVQDGMLLAIHLDRHEMGVDELRHLRVLERFTSHHVAPVA